MLIVSAVVGAGLLVLWFQRLRERFAEWLVSEPERFLSRAEFVLGGIALCTAASLFALAIWIWRLSTRVRSEGRFPPRGVKVVRDTRILRDREARRYASLGYGLATMIALLGLSAPVVFWRIYAIIEAMSM